MRALDRKLLRDLWRLRFQVLAIALLIACGVSVAVMAFSAQRALIIAQRDYYAQTRFADVFAAATRAPRSIAQDLARIDGVVAVDARAMKVGRLDIPGFVRPATVRLIALADDESLALNRIVLMQGRQPAPDSTNEAVALKTFLDAAGIPIGQQLFVVIGGRRMGFTIVGSALSPEFVYVPGAASALPDDAHQGVLWAPRLTAERAAGLGGAFSTVSVRLAAGASEPAVRAAVDRALAPYGGTPSYGRADQISNKFQDDRIARFGILAEVFPPVFVVIAAALVHLVLGRIVDVEREQIGLLKAFGYSNVGAAATYVKMAAFIGVGGVAAGAAIGGWMAAAVTHLLAQFMRFPHLEVQFSWAVFFGVGALSIAAAVAGSAVAVRRAARLSPAVAMQPLTPRVFRRGLIERLPFWTMLDQPTRMIVRRLERFPGRAVVTSVGLAVSLSLLIGSQFLFNSIDAIVDQAYFRARRWSEVIGYVDNRDGRALVEAARLPGVIAAEPVRTTVARLRVRGHEEQAAITGIEPNAVLTRALDVDGRPLAFEGRGLILSDALSDRLGVVPGSLVDLEITEGRRPRTALPVTAIDRDYAGLSVFMARSELNRLMGDGDVASGATLLVSPDERVAFYREIERRPEIVTSTSRDDTIAQFRLIVTQEMTVEMSFFLGFAAAIAFGVAYNMSRVALSERGRDLATLRVLGFTQIECAYILFGELLLLALVATPIGLMGGLGLAKALEAAFAHQDLRLPFVVSPRNYAVSLGAYWLTLMAAAGLVARRLWTFDLVTVLKTRE